MEPLTEETLARFIDGLRSGDPIALDEFWSRYGSTVQQIAERHLSNGVRRRLGPEDVAQSVYRTFFRRAQGGEFQFDDGDDLLRLLCAITLTKVREKTRFYLRKKRGLQNEVTLGIDTHSVAADVDPAIAAEFNDLLAAVLGGLDGEERPMLEFKLLGHSHEEIAEKLGCSERTVRRILKRVQAQFERIDQG